MGKFYDWIRYNLIDPDTGDIIIFDSGNHRV